MGLIVALLKTEIGGGPFVYELMMSLCDWAAYEG